MDEMEQIRAAKAAHGEWVGKQIGCNGIGIGVDSASRPCIKIFTKHMQKDVRDSIEQRLGEVNMEFVEIGVVEKQ